MPKIIELTVEINIERVSCPGVWLCQDGRVSLSVFALGTSYQTCLLPPMFPLAYKDIFYFRKRFQETCALNNICCLLKDETIYCELVQWPEDCSTEECTILAQYLGALNDVLFPPNMCSNEGVDLLMRRTKEFPGILSPKIEIATKMRIDEVWGSGRTPPQPKVSCHCTPREVDAARQKQVCHTPQYHRKKCYSANKRQVSVSRSRSRSRSGGSQSCCNLKDPNVQASCECPNPSTLSSPHCPRRERTPTRRPPCHWPCPRYKTCNLNNARSNENRANFYNHVSSDTDKILYSPTEERLEKILLESRYIEEEIEEKQRSHEKFKKIYRPKTRPCVCEICKRYHELFHTDCGNS